MHRKLHAGSVIQISVATMNATTGGADPNFPAQTYGTVFKRFNPVTYHLDRPVAGANDDPDFEAVQGGADHNVSRNFAWLPYHPGHVTLMPFQANMSILTGWMSGCWLALVSVGGANYFAHVGTETNAQHPSTIAVKNGIKIAIGAGVMTVQRAFQPVCQGSPNTLGCVSANRHFYTLGLSMSPTSRGAMKMRVDSKTRIAPQAGLPSGY